MLKLGFRFTIMIATIIFVIYFMSTQAAMFG